MSDSTNIEPQAENGNGLRHVDKIAAARLKAKAQSTNPFLDPSPKIRNRSIRGILDKIGDEKCPPELSIYFHRIFPVSKDVTMREAWLRVVYLQAIEGQAWASYFIADRTEGRVKETGSGEAKGLILDALDAVIGDAPDAA